MYIELPEIIEDFVKSNFTTETSNEIFNSFTIFDNYGIEEYDYSFLNLLPMQGTLDPGLITFTFRQLLNSQLDYLLLAHGIELVQDVSITYKNYICNGLYEFMNALPEVQQIVYNILVDDEIDNNEKLSNLIENFTTAKATSIMETLYSVSDDLIDRMIHLIDNVEEILVSNPKSIAIYKLFKEYVKSISPGTTYTIADGIAISGYPLGLEIEDYLPFCNRSIASLDEDHLAINLLSIYVISSDFFNNSYNEVYDSIISYYVKSNININVKDSFLKYLNDFLKLVGDNNEEK